MSWSRVIALVDIDAFYASVEQRDFPNLQGKPTVVVPSFHSQSIIAASYEARRFGIKVGTKLSDAKMLCNNLFIRQSRLDHYQDISDTIMNLLLDFNQYTEPYSVDEAYLDLTYLSKQSSIKSLAMKIKKMILQHVGLSCSIGISSDKTTAKIACAQNKPNGLTIIPPDLVKTYLQTIAIDQVPGVVVI